ncbi:MAG: HAD family phosphatase [Hydrogenophaga sp.]|uniref:HAD family hydrolase n=1 Tax=Hydrogenophaga sp. TaxID=1904254 RepID=UPI00272F3AEA|nr:HAD family phosphatase [Hydrogenophaga sp.]MDP2408298.1 HAD family phosphatase [Hydrogenophaga sp.]MDZ4176604.1 HAD family phosphatase [Hydrogenophaga sp.]
MNKTTQFESVRFEAVLFDCDGVLVDSEPITNGVLRQMLNEAGWALSQPECEHIFIGKAVRDERARIEAETGRPLTDDWMRAFYARRDERLRAELQTVAGALDAVIAAHAHAQGRIACASGADRPKVVMQIGMAGMAPYFGDRIFSGHDLPRSKPHPDVYLAAAAHLGADPARCLVIEDTATGAQAGLAAGATVWGYCQHGHGRAFDGLPVARVFRHMAELAQALPALR